jgi:hypothetical protein
VICLSCVAGVEQAPDEEAHRGGAEPLATIFRQPPTRVTHEQTPAPNSTPALSTNAVISAAARGSHTNGNSGIKWPTRDSDGDHDHAAEDVGGLHRLQVQFLAIIVARLCTIFPISPRIRLFFVMLLHDHLCPRRSPGGGLRMAATAMPGAAPAGQAAGGDMLTPWAEATGRRRAAGHGLGGLAVRLLRAGLDRGLAGSGDVTRAAAGPGGRAGSRARAPAAAEAGPG